ncbi:MAG: hypothetical protein H6587_02160 [Flavobacteriales bacterium]|nr:hypothetical protein [Flavobacteriales bacterium]MCB9363349.1 hypothetical protein [Flavobacteriales bacterium]
MDTKGLTRRLKFYGLGFVLGLVVVWATLLKDRDRAAWMPEGRTIEFLERTEIQISDLAKCQIACLKLDSSFMDESFWKNAKVNFKKSAVKRKPCPEYYISSTLPNNQKIIIYMESCEVCQNCEEGTATLGSIEINAVENCECE